MTQSRRLDAGLALALAVLAAALLLPRLGDGYLWQDEAQTALVARTILDGGLPRGTDGRNFFSQERGKEYGDDYLWKWHTWLSFYLVAPSLGVLGNTTFAARLPFALLGIASVVLSYFAGLALWRERGAALFGAGWLATSVPFLIFSRQCRYYAAVTCFSLLGLLAYSKLRRGARAPTLWLAAAAFLLFHTHYVYCATSLAAFALHAALFDRSRLGTVLGVGLAVAVVNAPFIVWFSDVRPGGDSYLASVLDLEKLARFSMAYVKLWFRWFFDSWLLLVLPLAVGWRFFRRESPWKVERETVSGSALLLIFCVATIVLLSALSPLAFYRYLTVLCAPAALLAGRLLGELAQHSRVIAAIVFAALLAAGPFSLHLHELRHDFQGPIEGIVRFLDRHASEDDVVAISYGDLPLKFYTDLRIVGGLTGEDFELARDADWIIVRRHTGSDEDRRLKAHLREILSTGRYRAHQVSAPDTQFQNREKPGAHLFGSASRRVPRVVIHERL